MTGGEIGRLLGYENSSFYIPFCRRVFGEGKTNGNH
jgi:hypothetical protein